MIESVKNPLPAVERRKKNREITKRSDDAKKKYVQIILHLNVKGGPTCLCRHRKVGRGLRITAPQSNSNNYDFIWGEGGNLEDRKGGETFISNDHGVCTNSR